MSGSHADSIELGGAYDGTVGVLGAVAALKGLQAAGFRPAASLEAVMFATEEAGRFNVPCLGRHAFSRVTGFCDVGAQHSSAITRGALLGGHILRVMGICNVGACDLHPPGWRLWNGPARQAGSACPRRRVTGAAI